MCCIIRILKAQGKVESLCRYDCDGHPIDVRRGIRGDAD
jgi:hypothetical protein